MKIPMSQKTLDNQMLGLLCLIVGFVGLMGYNWYTAAQIAKPHSYVYLRSPEGKFPVSAALKEAPTVDGSTARYVGTDGSITYVNIPPGWTLHVLLAPLKMPDKPAEPEKTAAK